LPILHNLVAEITVAVLVFLPAAYFSIAHISVAVNTNLSFPFLMQALPIHASNPSWNLLEICSVKFVDTLVKYLRTCASNFT